MKLRRTNKYCYPTQGESKVAGPIVIKINLKMGPATSLSLVQDDGEGKSLLLINISFVIMGPATSLSLVQDDRAKLSLVQDDKVGVIYKAGLASLQK